MKVGIFFNAHHAPWTHANLYSDSKTKTDDKGVKEFVVNELPPELTRADPGAEDEEDAFFNAGAGQTYEEIKAALNDTGIEFFDDDMFGEDIFDLRHPSEDCRESEVRCDDGMGCYSPEERCDRFVQCNDNSDEAGCTCSDYLRNVAKDKVCDGYNDCPDGSDERGKQIFLI